MDLNDAAVFAKVVQVGSFTGAAKLLGMPNSTVSAKVTALERHLGVRLLQRTTRKLNITQEGRSFFEGSVRALNEFELAESSVLTSSRSPQGLIKVTCPLDIGTRFMPEFLKKFLTAYPELSIQLVLTGRIIDLISEGVDVAIRATNLKDSSLIAKKIGSCCFGLFASPTYLKDVAHPRVPADLEQHKIIRHSSTQPGAWNIQRGATRATVPVKSSLSTDELSAVEALILAGHGVGLIPLFIAKEHVKNGNLVRLLPQWDAYPDKLYVVYGEQKLQHPRLRLFINEVVPALEKFLE